MKIELERAPAYARFWRGFHLNLRWFYIDLGLIGFDYYHSLREVVIRFWKWELTLYFKVR